MCRKFHLRCSQPTQGGASSQLSWDELTEFSRSWRSGDERENLSPALICWKPRNELPLTLPSWAYVITFTYIPTDVCCSWSLWISAATICVHWSHSSDSVERLQTYYDWTSVTIRCQHFTRCCLLLYIYGASELWLNVFSFFSRPIDNIWAMMFLWS